MSASYEGTVSTIATAVSLVPREFLEEVLTGINPSSGIVHSAGELLHTP